MRDAGKDNPSAKEIVVTPEGFWLKQKLERMKAKVFAKRADEKPLTKYMVEKTEDLIGETAWRFGYQDVVCRGGAPVIQMAWRSTVSLFGRSDTVSSTEATFYLNGRDQRQVQINLLLFNSAQKSSFVLTGSTPEGASLRFQLQDTMRLLGIFSQKTNIITYMVGVRAMTCCSLLKEDEAKEMLKDGGIICGKENGIQAKRYPRIKLVKAGDVFEI